MTAVSRDPSRPQYHFTAPQNWLNDPNGLIHWNGRYHLFYQHNPAAPHWGLMHWGHAVSTDLVNWQHLPVALKPSPAGPDQDGCFSGCAVDNDGVPTMLYTGVQPEVQCLALSRDNLQTLEKHPQNPVIAAPPPDLDLVGFRDPCVWRQEDSWHMVIGSGIRGAGGAILRYRSADLIHWEYQGPLMLGELSPNDPIPTGTMWECPSFFPLDDLWVLMICASGESGPLVVLYTLGEFDGKLFAPLEPFRKVDYGDAGFYAPQTFVDASGRRLMIGWLNEARDASARERAGWAGAMSLPRQLKILSDPDFHLGFSVIPEIEALRGDCLQQDGLELASGEEIWFTETNAHQLEIDARVIISEGAACELILARQPGAPEWTSIRYDNQSATLTVDTTHASLDPGAPGLVNSIPLPLQPGEPLSLRIFVDHSVIEIFANDWACLSARAYPTSPDQLLSIKASAGDLRFERLHLWQFNVALPYASPPVPPGQP